MDNRVRITAQLIDSHDDKHLWSETYDRHLSDIFRIQDEIASAVVDALREELGIDEDEARLTGLSLSDIAARLQVSLDGSAGGTVIENERGCSIASSRKRVRASTWNARRPASS